MLPTVTRKEHLWLNVKNYGAAGDGSHDDAAAITAAIDAAVALIGTSGAPVTVFFPPGIYSVASGGAVYAIPKSLGNVLRLSGYGAQVKLSTGCPRFLDFNRTADYDTFQNLWVEGFAIDANNVGGKHHVIIGNYQAGVSQNRLNFQDITIQDVRAFNIVTSLDDSVDRRSGIALDSHQLAAAETATSIRRIVLRRIKLEGGNKGIAVVGSMVANAAGYTQYIDDVLIEDCYHDTVTLLASNPSGGTLNFHIGSGGYGGRCRIKRCYGRGSGDVGVEVNALTSVVVEDTRIEEAAGYSFYHTNYNNPEYPNAQEVVFDRCVSRNLVTTGSNGFRLNLNNSVNLGVVKILNCKRHRSIAGANAVTRDAVGIIAPIREAIIEGLHVNIDQVAGSGGALGSVIEANSTGIGNLIIRDVRIRYVAASAAASPQLVAIRLESGSAAAVTIDNVRFSSTLASWAASQIIRVGASASSSFDMTIRRLVCDTISSSSLTGISISASTTLTIPNEIVIEDCDFRNGGGSWTDVSIGDATNRAKVRVDATNRLKGSSTTVASATTVTLTDPGELHTISGTTTITSVTSSWAGRRVTLLFSGALTFTDGSNLKLASDFVTTADDTITLVCDGTNWYEAGRSVN